METQNPCHTSSTPPIESPQQPPFKKHKMSSTSDDETTTTTTKPRRYKRRKVAIFFAYCGVGYQGMQKNPGAKTIEGDFEEALYQAGAVPEEDRAQPKRFDWARSARTDKGVSAVGQVVSGKFYVDPPGFIDRLNANLVPQIRVFGYKRVTASFSAKKFCDRRRYVYLIPVFALDPSCHRDRESVLASVGSGNELVKCFECSERGRKVVGLMGNKRVLEGFNGSPCSARSGISSNSECALVNTGENESCLDGNGDSMVLVECGEKGKEMEHCNVVLDNNNAVDLHKDGVNSIDSNDNEVKGSLKNDGDSMVLVESGNSLNGQTGLLSFKGKDNNNDVDLHTNAVNSGDQNVCGNGEGSEKKEKKSEFKYGDEERERFNRMLKYYEGTHNFHNFTTRTKPEDPSAKRYIVSFQANTTVTVEGIEFVKCEVVGQSFMLHQIRKMMGLAVAIMRNFASESIFERAFRQDVNINVPTAPEVGLYLDECFFTSYNNRWKDTHEEISMKDYAEEAEEFKLKHVYSHIANTEHKEGAVALWLHSLNYRNYSDLRPVESDERVKIESERAEAGTLTKVDSDERINIEGEGTEAETLAKVDSDERVNIESESTEVETLAKVDSVECVNIESDSTEAKKSAKVDSDERVKIESESAEAETLVKVDSDECINIESECTKAEKLAKVDSDERVNIESQSIEAEKSAVVDSVVDSDERVSIESKSIEAEKSVVVDAMAMSS